jgi:hypothetical protein
MNPILIAKIAAGLIASSGVGSVVGHVIKNNVPATTNLIQKVGIFTGTIVISGIAGNLAQEYVNKQIDTIVIGYKKGKEFGEKLTENLS